MKVTQRSILAFVDLVQDIDVLLPVLLRLSKRPEFRLRVIVSSWLRRRAPRVASLLSSNNIGFHYVVRPLVLRGWSPRLANVDILLTASESSAGPHRWSHALAARANDCGIATFTLQHGIDNLQVLASGAADDRIRIASKTVFCWTPEKEYPSGLTQDARAKLVSVGRPSLPRSEDVPAFDMGVFENLHAKVYSDSQRRLVLERITGFAHTRPDLRIYLRAHPAGGWLDHVSSELLRFANVTCESSAEARRSTANGMDVVHQVARVITTPSTVALDAAQAGRPVALALEGGPAFSPLPVLRAFQDWLTFAAHPQWSGETELAFVARHVIQGDASEHIISHLLTANAKFPCALNAFELEFKGER